MIQYFLQVENYLGCRDYDEGGHPEQVHGSHGGQDWGRKELTKTSLQVIKQRKRFAGACAENSV